MGCRFDPNWSYRGLDCLRLENEHVAIDLLPELGAKVLHLVDKARDTDVLWHSQRVLPHRAPLSANFDDHWAGGWDEAFPGGVPTTNRYGDELPHMGELWTQTAEWRLEEHSAERVVLVCSITTPITPARWERRMELSAGSPVLQLRYRIENLDWRPFDFNWGIHPAQAISPAHRFDAPAKRAEVDEHGGGVLGQKGDTYAWPRFGELDVRRALDPEAGDFALHYLTELEDGWVACTDTAARRGFGLVFDRGVFPVVWLWLVYGGWRGYYHAIMEPWTGWPSSLSEAIAAGRARSLEPGEALETEVSAVLYGGVESVSQLESDGSVRTQ
jgi:galactose mutarotase-like enzyme